MTESSIKEQIAFMGSEWKETMTICESSFAKVGDIVFFKDDCKSLPDRVGAILTDTNGTNTLEFWVVDVNPSNTERGFLYESQITKQQETAETPIDLVEHIEKEIRQALNEVLESHYILGERSDSQALDLRMGLNEYEEFFEGEGWKVTEEPDELPTFAYCLSKDGVDISFNGNIMSGILYLG